MIQETTAQRVRRLHGEARDLARTHTGELLQAMHELQALAADVTNGGDPYLHGIRDEARQLADYIEQAGQRMEAIQTKAGS